MPDQPDPQTAEEAIIAGIRAKADAGKALKLWEAKRLEDYEGRKSGKAKVTAREREAAERKRKRAISRDIGPSVDAWVKKHPRDHDRWERCRLSLKNFCEEYHPDEFYNGWSPDHLRVIEKLEQSILHGGLFAMAMPRGSGKTTLAEKGAEWAELYGHRQFTVIIGATEAHALEMLQSIKTSLETNDLLGHDFPAVVRPIRELAGVAQRASGQMWGEERTHVGWTGSEIILPSGPPGYDGHEGYGGIIRVAGITGRIRGLKFQRSDGQSARPDFAILDDPQTDESSRSVSQCGTREGIINGAVLGLAGPGKKISAVMPCTVICPDDMVDRILDRDKHPEWNGERTKMVYAWPSNTDLWDEYQEIWADSLREHGTIEDATRFYLQNRDEMDRGAVVAWEDRYEPGEVSAIQHAFNTRLLRGDAAFFAEYQNDPLPDATHNEDDLTIDDVLTKLNGYERNVPPDNAAILTAYVDIQKHSLWYVVCAWSPDFQGWVIDYGVWPDQGTGYVTNADIRVKFSHKFPSAGTEGQIHGALQHLTNHLLNKKYVRPGGEEMRIERLLIDTSWGEYSDTVYDFVKQSPFSNVLLPGYGRFYGVTGDPMNRWKRKRGEKAGPFWIMSFAGKRTQRSVRYDTGYWKNFLNRRLATALGDPGGLTLWGKDRQRHQCFADHATSEYREKVKNMRTGLVVDVWKLRPTRDNHWFDGVVGCAVAASIQGATLSPQAQAKGQTDHDKELTPATADPFKPRLSFREMWEQRRRAGDRS